MSADVQVTDTGVELHKGLYDTDYSDGYTVWVDGEDFPRVFVGLNPADPAGGAGSVLVGFGDDDPTPVAQAEGGLIASNNLSDVVSAATSRTNLGLGTAATTSAATYLTKADNLASVASASAARTNLGLGTAATQASGAFDAAGTATTAAAARVSSGSAVVAIGAIAALTATDVTVTLSSTMASTAYNAIPFLNLAAADLALGIGVDLRVKSQTTTSVTVSVNNTTAGANTVAAALVVIASY